MNPFEVLSGVTLRDPAEVMREPPRGFTRFLMLKYVPGRDWCPGCGNPYSNLIGGTCLDCHRWVSEHCDCGFCACMPEGAENADA